MKREEFLNLVCANTLCIQMKDLSDMRAEMKCYFGEKHFKDIELVCDLLDKIVSETSKDVRKEIEKIPFEE